MEHIIFLHVDDEAWAVLHQAQQSTAQHLVLVVPPPLDQLRLTLLLRLIRRHTALQEQHLSIVSEDQPVRLLAERMGCTVAATLDEYHELAPSRTASLTNRRRPGINTRLFAPRAGRHEAKSTPVPQQEQSEKVLSASPLVPSYEKQQRDEQAEGVPHQPRRPTPSASQTSTFQRTTVKPGTNLDAILVDGYLPNPATIPGLDEEDERPAGEETQHVPYEIADETHPSLAQQETEKHEAWITARIRTTGTSHALTNPAPSPVPTRDDPSAPDASTRGRLRRMRSIDELLQRRGQESPIDWFE